MRRREGLSRVIGVDGVPDRRLDGLGDEALLAIHRSLVMLRTYDERSVVYHSQGGSARTHLLGSRGDPGRRRARARGRDWIFPSYRESAIGLLRGLPARRCCSGGEATRRAGGTRPRYGVASICVPIATQSRTRPGSPGAPAERERRVALVLFGDGATSEGAFHEGANIAAVMRAPLVLLCNNNQWAISTPLRRRPPPPLADKAVGTGCPASRVDGARRARRLRGGRARRSRARARARARRSSRR